MTTPDPCKVVHATPDELNDALDRLIESEGEGRVALVLNEQALHALIAACHAAPSLTEFQASLLADMKQLYALSFLPTKGNSEP